MFRNRVIESCVNLLCLTVEINFVNTYRVRITHDSLKLKILDALKQKQQDYLTIIRAQVVPIKDHIDLAQFAKRVKEPAVVLIPWIS